jgi:F-box/leucine-rich repeat protein 14
VASLLKCPSLRQLNVAATQLTSDGIVALASARKLEGLDLIMTKPGPDDDALTALSRLTALKRLRLNDAGYTEEGVIALGKLAQLELLALGGSGVTDSALEHIAKCPRLRQLTISRSPISSTALASLGALKSLEVLDLVGNQHLTVGGLAKLNSLTNLRFLYVRGAGIAEDGARLDLGGLRSLTDLMLQFSAKRLRAEHLACLKSLKNLRSLQLVATTVNDEALGHLRGLTNLYRLRIGGPEVTDAGLAHLTALRSLEDLGLVGNISDDGLRHLEPLSGLQSLQIKSSQEFSEAAVKRLRKALPGLKRLRLD